MRIVTSIIIVFTLSEITQAQQSNLEKQTRASIEKHYTSLERLYTQLHANPELSQKEEKTAATMAEELRKLGFDVSEKIGGHGVAGVMRNGNGPTILIRTDMDALPIEEKTNLPYASRVKSTNAAGAEVHVMHACVHDIHMTVFVGTARALS